MKTIWPGYMGTTTNLRIVLNTPKNPYLIIKLPKNFLLKKIQELKISPPAPQNHLILPVTWNLEYPPPPPPPGINGRHSFDFVCIVLGPAVVLIFGCNTFFPSKICCLFEGAAY